MKTFLNKILISGFVVMVSFNSAYSQDFERVNLEKEGSLLSTQAIGNGLVFVLYNNDTNYLIKYNDNFTKDWTRDIVQEVRSYLEPAIDVVSSPSKKLLYTVQIGYRGYHSKPHIIASVDENGNVRKYEIEGRDEFGKELQTIFCNDDYLYYLATDNGDQNHKRKKEDEKLILNSFSNATMEYTRKVLDLPIVEGDEEIFWEYIGHNNSEFYLASKKVDEDENLSEIKIITFDNQGNKLRESKYTIQLDENDFIRPFRIVTAADNIYSDKANLDYTRNTQTGSVYPTYGGFTGVHYKDGHVYFYGLYGPGKFKRVAAKYEGAYVMKYDLEGNLIWKNLIKDVGELTDNKHFRVHATPGLRSVYLNALPDGTINLDISVAERMSMSKFRFVISPDGLERKFDYIEKINDSKTASLKVYYDDSKNHGLQFIKTTDMDLDKNDYFGNILTDNLEVLYQLDAKDRSINNIFLLKK